MYSNLITPPDFVEDKFKNIVLVNFDAESIELLGRYLMVANESYNVYTYKQEMDETDWLLKAVELSDCVIVNCNAKFDLNMELCGLEKSYTVGLPTHKNNLENLLNYFELENLNK